MPDAIICTVPLSAAWLLLFCGGTRRGADPSPVADGERRKDIIDVLGGDSKSHQE